MFFTVFSESSGLDLSGGKLLQQFANLLEDFHVEPLNMAALQRSAIFWGVGIGIVSRLVPVVPSISLVIGLSIAYLTVALSLFVAAPGM